MVAFNISLNRFVFQRFRQLVKSSSTWGPRLPEHRALVGDREEDTNNRVAPSDRNQESVETVWMNTLLWRHNGCDGVSNHQPHNCLLNRSGADQRKHQSSSSLAFVWWIHRWIPAQMASSADNVSIWGNSFGSLLCLHRQNLHIQCNSHQLNIPSKLCQMNTV